MNNYFEYQAPYQSELRDMYYPEYKAWDFSDELKHSVHHIFSHPFNKYHKLFYRESTDLLVRDMCKPAYLLAKYYIDNPQQFNNELSNIAPMMLTRMWKKFLNDNKRHSNVKYDEYMATKMKMMKINGVHFALMFIREIKDDKAIIYDSPKMIKHRHGKSLRENNRAGLVEGKPHFEHLCSLV